MSADNLERKEVEELIQELSSSARKRVVVKPAGSKADGPGAEASQQPVAAARSFGKGPLEPIAPNTSVKKRSTFLSAINLPPMPEIPGGRRMSRFPRMPRLSMPGVAGAFTMPSLPELPQFVRPSAATTVRMCVGLGVLLCMAMPYWPYPKGCSWWLWFYMLAVAVVVIAGVWAARLTWGARLAIAHMVAVGIVFWGITLAAEETLPRIGYAKAEAHWLCP